MDALTHTILALACMAGAYYGGRWLQMREARRMWGDIATPAMKREIQLMDALIKHMSREDRQYIAGITRDVSDHCEYEYEYELPRQLELFAEHDKASSQ